MNTKNQQSHLQAEEKSPSESIDPKVLEEARENSRTILKILTEKKHVLFTNRGNASIKLAMRLVARLGKSNVLYQEEGGWLTYKKSIEQARLQPVLLSTNDGLVQPGDLPYHEHDSALLVNSLPGYAVLEDMNELANVCFANNIILVNDVSGSIGTEEAKIGEIIIGSFGKAKPLDLGKGGFIAIDDDEMFEELRSLDDDYEEPLLNYVLLEKKLRGLDERRTFLSSLAEKIKVDLKDMNIVHRDGNGGLNVIIRFENEGEKDRIIQYCEDNDFEFTVCPREIRILDDAISIEVKRRVE